MNFSQFIQLLFLAAIWGASFLFMRISVPVVGAATTTFFRLFIAALFLLAVCLAFRKQMFWKKYWKHYLLVGLVNSAIPFYCYSLAAKTTNVSILAIINSMAPIWGAVFSYFLAEKKLSYWQISGLFIGIFGVAVLVAFDSPTSFNQLNIGVLLGVFATACYGLISTYTSVSKVAKEVDFYANANGSIWFATACILPLFLVAPPNQIPNSLVIMSLLGLGILSSGVAYLIYFKLIGEIGAASSLTVTYLIPLFGVLWGWLFLKENITSNTFIGAAIVLLGTMLVNKILPLQFTTTKK